MQENLAQILVALKEELMKAKFEGSYEELQERVRLQGIEGVWRICGDAKHRQFLAASGAILNFWITTKSLVIDVDRSEADRELSTRLHPVFNRPGNTLAAIIEEDIPSASSGQTSEASQ